MDNETRSALSEANNLFQELYCVWALMPKDLCQRIGEWRLRPVVEEAKGNGPSVDHWRKARNRINELEASAVSDKSKETEVAKLQSIIVQQRRL